MRGQDFYRLHSILESDKEEMNEASKAAALADFSRVAEEYFETDGSLSLEIERGKRGAEVIVKIPIRRVKNFTRLK